MKIYLSGPMTGFPDLNYPAFHAGAKALRELGHDVFNPAESFGGDRSLNYSVYLREDIKAILGVDAVVVLPGWERSRGARLEVEIASAIAIDVRSIADILADVERP